MSLMRETPIHRISHPIGHGNRKTYVMLISVFRPLYSVGAGILGLHASKLSNAYIIHRLISYSNYSLL